MTVHHQAATGFARATAVYQRARPGYPAATVRWLTRQLGLRSGTTVLDLAAGTGKLTRALPATGATVIAVEPVGPMVAELVTSVRDVLPVAATAQALPFADGAADAITVAQAFHWFATDAALGEMVRVLTPDGAIGLVWNHRTLDDPLQHAVEQIITPHRRDTPSHASGRWRAVVEASPVVEVAATHAVPHDVATDADGLVDRVLSTSYIAALPAAARADVAARVRGLAREAGAELVLRHTCASYLLIQR
jgi:SAM-dependent methyltransferase